MSINLVLITLNVTFFFAATAAFHYGKFKAGFIFTGATIAVYQVRKLITGLGEF